MTSTIICILCVLLLIAYFFDLTSEKTRIPSVILLLFLGWLLHRLTDLFEVSVPNLSPLLPICGTVGLIMIVLEGSLELELDKTKVPLIGKSLVMALVSILLLAFGLAWALYQLDGVPFRTGLINAIPVCVISSAIAIPSAKSLNHIHREFVVYESSISDILGVLFFNFVALNEAYTPGTFFHFSLQLVLIAIVSCGATIGLAWLLRKINHHIKFTPIIIMLILIYAVSKIYHLPALLFILIFGLAIGNLDELKRFRWIRMLEPEELHHEVQKLKHLTIEMTFLIRAVFFILFGYLIKTAEILDPQTFVWAAGIVAGIFIIRALLLRVVGLGLQPLFFIAPRGLITILLFLSIIPELNIPMFRRSLIIQIILLTALMMMIGMIFAKRRPGKVEAINSNQEPGVIH